MRPIPAPRLGDAHGLLRAIGQRERLRLDEFVTDFTVEELFPPGLENALGRMRQFVSFARSAGLVDEDRGTVELTEMGKRYVRAGDTARPFDVAPAQAEWLRRLLRERQMTDSIYHGAAVGLSLCASNPAGFRASTLDFGRALNHLGRAGWDNENTFRSQGERYTTFLIDMELVDEERRLTASGERTREELTLPEHTSLRELAGQLNPGGLEAAVKEGEEEYAPEPVAEFAPEIVDEAEYEDVGRRAGAPEEPAAPAAASIATPAPAVARLAPLVSAAAIRSAAEEAGLRLPAGAYAAAAAALAAGHVVLVGPAGCGKTTLALAIAKAAAQSGKASGATLVTAAQRWSARDTVGRAIDGEWRRGVVVDAAARGRWLVVDELDRARLDRALGELSSFLAGIPVTLPDGETAPPGDWRIVATAGDALTGSAALVRRFAHVHVPQPRDVDLAAAISAAAGADAVAGAAVRRLVGARELGPVGTGAFLAAARFAAERNAAAPVDEATLAREALAAHIAPLLGRLDEDGRAKLVALTG
jgi:MoxR-like ATPase